MCDRWAFFRHAAYDDEIYNVEQNTFRHCEIFEPRNGEVLW